MSKLKSAKIEFFPSFKVPVIHKTRILELWLLAVLIVRTTSLVRSSMCSSTCAKNVFQSKESRKPSTKCALLEELDPLLTLVCDK